MRIVFDDRLGEWLRGRRCSERCALQRVVLNAAGLLQGLQGACRPVANGPASFPTLVALVHAPFPSIDVAFVFVWPDVYEGFVRAVGFVFRLAGLRIGANVLLEIEQRLCCVVVVAPFQFRHVLLPEFLGSELGFTARRRVAGSGVQQLLDGDERSG
eukprot:1742061-Pleurochrysis_carterae.AAC.1